MRVRTGFDRISWTLLPPIQWSKQLREIDGALIVDGLVILLKMAETAVRIQGFTGMFVSRKMLYQMPGQVVRERAKQDYRIDLS